MSLNNLKVNSLYIILFIRDDPPEKDDFHWGLYLHQHAFRGGIKYHIKGQGSGWMTDHGPTAGVFKSFLLIGLFRIVDIIPGQESYIDQTIRTCDSRINDPGVNCVIWVFWALELLRKENDGYIPLKCDNLTALEREINDWGNIYAP